jgi:hypothetical protein
VKDKLFSYFVNLDMVLLFLTYLHVYVTCMLSLLFSYMYMLLHIFISNLCVQVKHFNFQYKINK